MHFGVMMNLRHRTLNIGELAERFVVSAPSMSKTVTALVNRGWVERARSQEDRRVVQLYLTDEGRAVLGRMRELTDQAAIETLSVLSPEERQQLSAGLDTLYKALGEPFSDEAPAPNHTRDLEE
jgi:DNA-binding MarR family transcriptional regulator